MASFKPIPNTKGEIKSYKVTVFMGRDSNGKQIIKTTTWKIPEGMKNPRSIEKAVRDFAVLYERDCKLGLIISDKKTFQEYAEYVLSLKERDNKHRTVVRYKELLKRIYPEIGYIKLVEVSGEHINRLLLNLAKPGQNKNDPEKGLSPKTIREHYRVIHMIYEQAKKEGLVRYNIAESATPPKVKKEEAEYYEIETVLKIKECLKNEPLKWRVIVELLIASGARRGEVMGLKWNCIDFENGTIRICNNLLYAPDIGIYEDTPKNGESREIAIAPEVMNLLAEWKQAEAEHKICIGKKWHETGFCFTRENGEPMFPDSVTDYLAKFSKRYDLPHIHPHAFRHTHITILLSEGVDIATVAKRAGHKQVSTTENIYAHVLAKADTKANDVIVNVLYGNKEKKDE